jgi:hypothetical protein
MDQVALVETQIQDGQRLLDRLARVGVLVTAAAWVKESESGQWFLYLVTPLVGEDGAKRPAYRRVNAVVRLLQQEGFTIDPFEIKVIGPHHPFARDLLAYWDRRPIRTPTWFRGSRLGELAVEVAYFYPLRTGPKEAAGVDKQ